MSECELCNFNNPKCSVTAAIIKDNKLLLLKRNEEPFKDKWDLPGGYMSPEETPESAIKREVKEELGIDCTVIPIIELSGTAYWKNKNFPILSHFFLVDIENQEIKLNEENTEFLWIPLKDIKWQDIAWDSNRKFIETIIGNLMFDLKRVEELIKQLDSTAELNEQRLYRAFIQGGCTTLYENGELIGLGWAFIRETMLRKQAVIEDMIVDEAHRGKGYGKQLLNNLIEICKSQGVEVIELTTNPKRVAAHALYESFGFKIHITDHMLLKI